MNNIPYNGLVKIWPEMNEIKADIINQLKIEATYSVYLEKQQADIIAFKKDESLLIPFDFDYNSPEVSLSNESRVKFTAIRPANIGAASRIPGITPAAVATILVALKKKPSGATSSQLA
jgi:tRNA uridine 5-carboxymethylaminomethyl modification enzyme